MRAVIVLLALATGCGPIFYYGFPKTRTYEYERRVPVMVDSEPAGATIVAADGTVLGQAPVLVDQKVRVRHKYRSNSPARAMLGCMIDIGIMIPSVVFWDSRGRFDDTLGTAVFVAGLVPFTQCVGLVVLKGYNLGLDPLYRSMQVPPIFTSPVRTDEEVVSRSVDIIARWGALGEARGKIALPGQSAVTLRLDRHYTFDEALVLWERNGERAPTTEGLYRLGMAYRSRAATTPGAGKRALDFFGRYLETGDAAHADEVKKLVQELEAKP